MSTANDRYLRPPEAASLLRVSVSTLAKWRLRGFGPRFVKLSRAVAYPLSEIDAFVEAQLRSSTSDVGRTLDFKTAPPGIAD